MKPDYTGKSAGRRRTVIMIICFLMGFCLLAAFILLGNSGYTGSGDAKAYVLGHHTAETGAENAVTAVYLNYRLWDTLFESLLLLVSALAVISFSWSYDHEE